MAWQPIVISLTPVELAACEQRLVRAGVAVPQGYAGSLTHEGVTVTCDYDGTDTLTVRVVDKPCWVSEGYVENKIRGWFAEVRATGEAQCQ